MIGLFQGHDDLIRQFFYLLQILNQPRDAYLASPYYYPPQPYDAYSYASYYPYYEPFPSVSPIENSFYPSNVQLPSSVPFPQQQSLQPSIQASLPPQSQSQSQPQSSFPSQPQTPSIPAYANPASNPSVAFSPSKGSLRPAANDAVPFADRRFFEQVRRDISSEEVYQQFLKLLDLFNRDILPLSELFSAVTDLLHIRHPVVSHLRNFLAQKGIREDEVGSARRFDL